MKRKYTNNFLKEDITKEFSKYGFGFLYIGGDLDSLFAVNKIQYPLDDVPYIEYSGIEVNDLRDVEEFVHLKEKVKNLIKNKTMREFKTSSNNQWIYESPIDYEEN